MNGNIVWLASYPKSGNTWFRMFISNLLSNEDQPVSINRLLGLHSNYRDLFDNLTGIDSSNLMNAEADAMRPALYEKISRDAKEICWMKTHDAYRHLPDRQSLFPPQATRCTIYIIRNPLDVVPSYAQHMAMEVDEIIHNLNDEQASINTERENITGQLRQTLSSWSGNVLSWLNAPSEMKVHVMRYEDMKKFPLETFGAAVKALGLVRTEAQIQRALEFSSFAVLKEMELRDGFRERPAHSKSFFREGKIGTGRSLLTREQVASIVEKHRAVMQRFGYLDQQGNLVDG